jgi:hypothetical protein
MARFLKIVTIGSPHPFRQKRADGDHQAADNRSISCLAIASIGRKQAERCTEVSYQRAILIFVNPHRHDRQPAVGEHLQKNPRPRRGLAQRKVGIGFSLRGDADEWRVSTARQSDQPPD